MNIWVICHIVSCFLLIGTIVVGLTRKNGFDNGMWIYAFVCNTGRFSVFLTHKKSESQGREMI